MASTVKEKAYLTIKEQKTKSAFGTLKGKITMKLKEGFILRQIADTYIVVAIGEEAKKANVMITLNETGGFLWQKLSEGATEDELVSAILSEYEIDEATAKADVSAFIAKVKENDLLI